MQLLFDALF